MDPGGGRVAPEPITVLRERPLPEPARAAGYAALIDAFGLEVPLPRRLCATGRRHKVYEARGWRILTPRHAPGDGLAAHLTFALKHEGVDLAVLRALFAASGGSTVETWVRETPTGSYARRAWFLYEWLMGGTLDLDPAASGAYVGALDPDVQWAVDGSRSPRHRVVDNLPGTRSFCPLAYRTELLERYVRADLASRARRATDALPPDLVARAAAFLLLSDSRSSFAIEGESPPQDRIQRWGMVLGGAGSRPVTLNELVRLQRAVIGDTRFVTIGLRREGGFVGARDRVSGAPIPEHVSARAEDLPDLVEGLIRYEQRTHGALDPVIAAACLAFGFVYIHPFDDGNGRVHRYLIHHVMASEEFSPPGFVFPVSAVMLERVGEYREVLRTYSRRLLPLIRWKPTADGNVEVLAETADWYRYFDATPHAEFLYSCVEQTLDETLPGEVRFLRAYEAFRAGVSEVVDMPERLIDRLFRFLHQNDGRLSRRAREREFSALTGAEVSRIEDIYAHALGDRGEEDP